MKCSYCGNTSGMRDSRGGCISCGAQEKAVELDFGHNQMMGGLPPTEGYWVRPPTGKDRIAHEMALRKGEATLHLSQKINDIYEGFFLNWRT